MTRDANTLLGTGASSKGDETLPKSGDIFDGKYRIGRTIGRGAMAVVLEATHLQLEDRVAIKILLPRWAEQSDLVERFMREGRAATRIRSEHVVRVFDVGVVGDHPYLVMEYLDGSDLDRILENDGPLPVTLAVDYLLQAGEAIAEAHAHGIVHRDLKPANLFLTRRADGSACVKVLDFGISKAAPSATPPDTRTTEPAAVMGSPHYMSPEQMLSSTDVDARSDLWALGAILHELLAGAPAFDADTIAALSASVLRDPAVKLTSLRADVPAAVEATVLRCLEKQPSKRFANVADLASALAPYGSASAQASADRIARVLEAGTAKTSHVTARPPEIRPDTPPRTVASLLVGEAPAARARNRMLGYVVAAVAFVAIGGWIVAMVVKEERAASEQMTDAGAAVPPVLTNAGGALAAVVDAGGTAVAASPTEPAGKSGEHANADANERAGGRPGPAHGGYVEPSHPPTHARGPKRGPRPPSSKIPPLPDFPVPSAGAEGEPSSRPIQTTPDTPAPPPVPASSVPSAPAPTPAPALQVLPAPQGSGSP